MEDTGFYVPTEKADRLAPSVYDDEPDGSLVPSASLNRNFLEPPGLPMGGGELVSTVIDYMHFSYMLLNGGELDPSFIPS